MSAVRGVGMARKLGRRRRTGSAIGRPGDPAQPWADFARPRLSTGYRAAEPSACAHLAATTP